MSRLILGGVVLAATGYGIIKCLSKEREIDIMDQVLIDEIGWRERIGQSIIIPCIDGLLEKIDTYEAKQRLVTLLNGLDTIKNTIATIIYNDLEEVLFYAKQHTTTQEYKPLEIKPIKNKAQKGLLYTEENYQTILDFYCILATANHVLMQHIKNIKASLEQQKVSNKTFVLPKQQIKRLYKIQTFLENVIYCPISIDNVTISNITKRSFNRIERTIEMFKTNDYVR